MAEQTGTTAAASAAAANDTKTVAADETINNDNNESANNYEQFELSFHGVEQAKTADSADTAEVAWDTADDDGVKQDDAAVAAAEEQVDTADIIARSSQMAGVIDVIPSNTQGQHDVSQASLDSAMTSSDSSASYIVLPADSGTEGEAGGPLKEAAIKTRATEQALAAGPEQTTNNLAIQSVGLNLTQTSKFTSNELPKNHHQANLAAASHGNNSGHVSASRPGTTAMSTQATIASMTSQPNNASMLLSPMTSAVHVSAHQQTTTQAQPLLSPNTLASLTQMISPHIGQRQDVTSLLQPIVERVLQNSAQAANLMQTAQAQNLAQTQATNLSTAVHPSMTNVSHAYSMMPSPAAVPLSSSAASHTPQQPAHSTGKLVSIVSQLTKQAAQPSASSSMTSQTLPLNHTAINAAPGAQLTAALLPLATTLATGAGAGHVTQQQVAPQTAPIMSLVSPSGAPLQLQYPAAAVAVSGSASAPSTPTTGGAGVGGGGDGSDYKFSMPMYRHDNKSRRTSLHFYHMFVR